MPKSHSNGTRIKVAILKTCLKKRSRGLAVSHLLVPKSRAIRIIPRERLAHCVVFMGGSVGITTFHVVKRYLIGVKVTSVRPVMAVRRSTFTGGEQQADSRFRSSTDAIFCKPPAKKQCSCLELVRGTIPGLVDSAHKGQLGRIGVIGGCQE